MHTKGHESSDSGHRSAIAQTDSVPATPEDTMLPFSFTQDESLQLNAEISGHFALLSVLCRVIGARPSRGKAIGLIQSTMEHGCCCEDCN